MSRIESKLENLKRQSCEHMVTIKKLCETDYINDEKNFNYLTERLQILSEKFAYCIRDFAIKTYATKNKFISADEGNWEVYSVPSSEYRKYLLKKVYDAFGDELESIKQSWIRKTPDEICSMCYTAVYISDVMNAIDNADAEYFDFEALERWLENPKKMIKTTCDYIVGFNSSDYNEAICDFINKGQEK